MADESMPELGTTEPELGMDGATGRIWRENVKRADARQKQYHDWWDEAVKSYAPRPGDSPSDYGGTVHTNRIFTFVERKMAELFYQRPDIQVSPSPALEAAPLAQAPGAMPPFDPSSVASTHGNLLNESLGTDGINVKRLAQRACFDYLLFAGGWTMMGYRAYTKPTPAVDPMTGQPTVVEVPVKTECFWDNLSPKQVVIPHDWTSTDFDKAPWLGWKFEMSLREAKRLYQLPDDFKGGTPSGADDTAMDHGDQPDEPATKDRVSGVQIWYRSHLYRDDVVHPDHLTEIVLLHGLETPVQHRDCLWQSFDEQGKITPDSIVGFPLHPLVVRTMTDAAYVMSDVAIALPLARELDTFRTQMITQREINLLRWAYNTGIVGRDELVKLLQSKQGGMVGFPPEAFQGNTFVGMAEIPQGQYPRENFEFNNFIDNDLARTTAIDATGSGIQSDADVTATEANIRQANVNTRLGWEQGFVADWFLSGVTKYAALMQRYLSVEDAAEIVGPTRAMEWDAWRQGGNARVSFSMAPDSSLRTDTPLERKMLQDLYSFLANDPGSNRNYLLKKLVAKHHLDPTQATIPPAQIPQPKPQPPSLSISIKGEDLSPLSPQSPIMLDILSKNGVQIDPMAITNAMALGQLAMAAQQAQAEAKGEEKDGQPPHGGKLPQQESLSKHAAALTGGQNGSGALVPGMGGGIQ